ncbi:MAG TPA: hypothetical protein PKK94_19925, partial [Leptospiraceae bacterium]|nr:hypothetical protein [Leptospiraceae bacterium]
MFYEKRKICFCSSKGTFDGLSTLIRALVHPKPSTNSFARESEFCKIYHTVGFYWNFASDKNWSNA